MSDFSKEELITKIFEWIKAESISLEELDFNQLVSNDETIDFKTIFNEISSIKSEMKQVTRIENRRIEVISDYFNKEQDFQQKFINQINNQNEEVQKIIEEDENIRKSNLFYSIFELRDFIERFYNSLQVLPFPQRKSIFCKKNDYSKISSILNENISFMLKKIDNILEKEGISRIQTLHQKFNSKLMIGIEIISNPSLENNIVVEELRKGYIYKNKVIRYPKVKVNKI